MLRVITDSVPALIAYFEFGSQICRFANRRYAEYNGWTPESILGKTVREAVGERHGMRLRRTLSGPLLAKPPPTPANRPCPTGKNG